MTGASGVLDDAFERLAASGFQLPNGFVNHGPMACEALAALGLEEEVDAWARRFARVPGPGVAPVVSGPLDWEAVLGDYGRLPEWIGQARRAIEVEGWPGAVADWVPRLLPGLGTVLYHGLIRTAHAVRALEVADTEPRRAELARALGYWAARFRPGRPASSIEVDDAAAALVVAGAEAAHRYLAAPGIVALHGVTGAMAMALLADHLPTAAAAAGLAQLRAEHAASSDGGLVAVRPRGVADEVMARAAAASGDPHQVKLVEACRRGGALLADPAFPAAAEAVTGLGLAGEGGPEDR